MRISSLVTVFRAMALCTAVMLLGTNLSARFLEPRDLWALARVGELRLAPGGRTACYTVQRWSVAGNRAATELWMLDFVSGRSHLLPSVIGTGEMAPAWSPDGSRIAYVSKSSHGSAAALHVVALADGQPFELTTPPLGAGPPQWMPDGRSIVFITRVIPGLTPVVDAHAWTATSAELSRRKSAKSQVRVAEGGFYKAASSWLTDGFAHRLVRVDLMDGHLTDLTPGNNRLFSPRGAPPFAISPDGRSLAVAINTVASDQADENDDIMLLPADGSGSWLNLTVDNSGGDSSPCFSPDGRYVLFGRRTNRIYAGENTKLFRHDLTSGKNGPLLPKVDLSFSAWSYAPDGQTILAVAEREGVTPVYRLKADGTDLQALTATGTAGEPLALPDGGVLLLHETFNHPPEVCLLRPGQSVPRALVQMDADAALLGELQLGQVEPRYFTGADGDRVHLWLVYPPAYDPRRKYPLIHLLHGGPNTMAGDGFSFLWNAQAFAARGAFVALVNRHGSTGFGERFARSVLGNWSEPACTDILRATDCLLADFPAIDPQRLAACGISYGGYLTACLAGRTDRFACLVSHAGISDLYAQYGSDLAAHLAKTFGGYPWEDQARFARNNPLTRAADFRTPMLILQGGRDNRVPAGNAFTLYGVLQGMGVPSRLVYFPDEAHWVQTPQDSLVWHEEVFQWLDRWLVRP